LNLRSEELVSQSLRFKCNLRCYGAEDRIKLEHTDPFERGLAVVGGAVRVACGKLKGLKGLYKLKCS
jgi:hypothetical protein